MSDKGEKREKKAVSKTLVPKTLVPKLRFPEFAEAGEWEEKRLGDVGKVSMCKRIMKHETAVSGDIPFYKIGTFGKQADAYISKELYENYKTKYSFPEKGDILISASGTIGRTVVYDGSPAFFQDSNIVWIANDEKLITNAFLLFCYKNTEWKTDDNTIARLYNDNLRSIDILIPTPPEQQKIAACLSSLDDLITVQGQKLETLKSHKKGLMQQLFPQKGQTTPQRRFPEFAEAGEWEETSLKKVFSIFQGFAFASKDSMNKGIRWLKIADVSIQSMNHDSPSYLPIHFKEKYTKFMVKEGDFVVALTRPILGKQLKIAPVDITFSGALLNQRVGKLVSVQNITFVYFLLQTTNLISNIEKSISGTEPPNLSAEKIAKNSTLIPKPPEQQKIAACLSSLDDLITAQSQKLETLKTHKKGLMQQLFPNPE